MRRPARLEKAAAAAQDGGRREAPLVFLDVDGVLNRRGHGQEEQDWLIERDLLLKLQAILTGCPAARIILSSSWRLMPEGLARVRLAMEEVRMLLKGSLGGRSLAGRGVLYP